MTTTTRREELHAYAPGDGAIGFCWQDRLTRNATGRAVTVEDATRYLDSEAGVPFRQKGYRVVTVDGRVRLVAPVRRGGDLRTLEVHGRAYRYEVDEAAVARAGGEVRAHAFTLYGRLEVPGLDREVAVRNESILAAARFFLNHEAALARD